MPSTGHGWPYPDGTAKVGELHTKIQDLASALERKLQGNSIVIASATGAVDFAVVYPQVMTNAPSVTLGTNADGTGVIVTGLAARFVTNTGFSFRINRSASNAAISGKWIALDYIS